ncbi:hypothetical protein DFQ14_106206 [Halopolyspora algeriensis]|uniref:Uncharacterized protein n=1 Tax=Halopolyspora algeriensis TaxID=1500506 RepID=A0A368VUS5_9ACTN|nr:hypothetical protein DFQ14_106206 [Halopolyspora algeriensis]TQM47491.1 hypothetical protein FHU43_3481 [Halopolyspora algeriensis]
MLSPGRSSEVGNFTSGNALASLIVPGGDEACSTGLGAVGHNGAMVTPLEGLRRLEAAAESGELADVHDDDFDTEEQ